MDYNLFETVKRIWALGKCAIEIIYIFYLFSYLCVKLVDLPSPSAYFKFAKL